MGTVTFSFDIRTLTTTTEEVSRTVPLHVFRPRVVLLGG
jgi:hypothetical protein